MTGAADLVDQYLQLCEDRDVEAATAHLSPSVRIEFPGGKVYRSLRELVAVPKSYKWVRKLRDRYAVGTEGDATVVTSIGRLYGQRIDGTTFEDIRYVDVFVIRDNLIVEQLVWNDLCENGFRVPPAETSEASTPAVTASSTSSPL